MNNIKFKVGDLCVIKERPTVWSSRLNENNPTKLSDHKFPLKIFIRHINIHGNYDAMTCGNFGWNLSNLIKENNIILIERPKYNRKKLKINGI